MSLRLVHSGPGVPGALDPRSHVTVRPPAPRRPAPLHPSLYDWEASPDRPAMPQLVTLSLSVLVNAARNPLTVPRPQVLEAAAVVEAWAKGTERDATPPHGTARPGA